MSIVVKLLHQTWVTQRGAIPAEDSQCADAWNVAPRSEKFIWSCGLWGSWSVSESRAAESFLTRDKGQFKLCLEPGTVARGPAPAAGLHTPRNMGRFCTELDPQCYRINNLEPLLTPLELHLADHIAALRKLSRMVQLGSNCTSRHTASCLATELITH